MPDNSPFRSQALRTSAGPRQHPTTPASSGQHPRPPSRPPLTPGDARFRSEPSRPWLALDSAGFGTESSRSFTMQVAKENRSIKRGPSPCLLAPISSSWRHGKNPLLEASPFVRAFPTHTSQWLFGDWGVRAGARESPGRPLGRQPPGPSAVPGVVAAPPLPGRHLSRPAAPRLRHSRKGDGRGMRKRRMGRGELERVEERAGRREWERRNR